MSRHTLAALPGLAIAAAVTLAAILTLALSEPAAAAPVNVAPICHEDERCWNWAKMGNLQRGVFVTPAAPGRATRAILTPCEFAYYDYAGYIDWQRTPRLRGDWQARRHGCNPNVYA